MVVSYLVIDQTADYLYTSIPSHSNTVRWFNSVHTCTVFQQDFKEKGEAPLRLLSLISRDTTLRGKPHCGRSCGRSNSVVPVSKVLKCQFGESEKKASYLSGRKGTRETQSVGIFCGALFTLLTHFYNWKPQSVLRSWRKCVVTSSAFKWEFSAPPQSGHVHVTSGICTTEGVSRTMMGLVYKLWVYIFIHMGLVCANELWCVFPKLSHGAPLTYTFLTRSGPKTHSISTLYTFDAVPETVC